MQDYSTNQLFNQSIKKNKVLLKSTKSNRLPEMLGNSNLTSTFRLYFLLLLIFPSILAVAGIGMRIYWLLPRSDEVITMLVTSVDSFGELLRNMRSGIDVSYLHNSFVFFMNQLFGASVLAQRLASYLFCSLAFYLLFNTLKNSGLAAVFCYLAIGFIAFSRLGVFLVTDGRFYALLFLFCIIHLYFLFQFIDKKPRWKSKFLLPLISVAGVLTTPLYFIYLLVVFIAMAGIVLFKKIKSLRSIAFLFAEIIFISCIYFIFIHGGIPAEILDSYTVARAEGNEVGFSYLALQFFKWFALPEISFIPVAISCAILLLFFLLIVVLFYRQKTEFVKQLNRKKLFFLFAGILSVLLLVFVFLYSRYVSAKPWEFRYFTPVFFFVGIALMIMVSSFKKDGLIQKYSLYFFAAVFVLQSVSLVQDGFKFREEKQLFLQNANKLFQNGAKTGETSENVVFYINHFSDIGFYNKVYSEFPVYRSFLKLIIPHWLQTHDNTWVLMAKNVKRAAYVLEQDNWVGKDETTSIIFVSSVKFSLHEKCDAWKESGFRNYFFAVCNKEVQENR